MTSRRVNMSRFARFGALSLAMTLIASACGQNESSGDRDRNVPTTPILFSKAANGVSRSAVGDVTVQSPGHSVVREQTDGSLLVLNPMGVIDKSGWHTNFVVTRITPDGVFDESFGSNGAGGSRGDFVYMHPGTVTNDGRLIFLRFTGGLLQHTVVGLRVLDAASGTAAQGYKDGNVNVPDLAERSASPIAADSKGRIHVLRAKASLSNPLLKMISRVDARGVDMSYGVGGGIAIPDRIGTDPTNGNGSYDCHFPAIWPSETGGIRVTYTCSAIGQLTPGDDSSIGAWRILAIREYDETGNQRGTDSTIWIDPPEVPALDPLRFNVLDIDVASPDRPNDHFITIEAAGVTKLLFVTNNFANHSPFDEQVFQFSSVSSSHATPSLVGSPNYVGSPTPRIVGLGIDSARVETTAFVAPYEPPSNFLFVTSEIRTGDYPAITHTVENLQFTGDGIFMNVPYAPLYENMFLGGGGQPVQTRDKFARIGLDGVVSTPGGVLPSPLNNGFPVPVEFAMSGLFPSNDGGMYAVGIAFEPDTVLKFQKFDASGSRQGEPITVDVGANFPSVLQRRISAAFDGVDTFVYSGWLNGRTAVTKVSLSAKKIDASFGENGHVNLPGDANAMNMTAGMFTPDLQINPDGSIDATEVSWATQEEDADVRDLIVHTVRYGANGTPDPNVPEASFMIQGVAACHCLIDALERREMYSVKIDPAGRILFARPTVEQTGKDNRTLGEIPIAVFGSIVRFDRTGKPDLTFGKNGVGGAPLADVGPEMAFSSPRLAVHPSGNIFMAMTALELSVLTDNNEPTAIALDGEYVYALMLDANGNPVNFKPQKQNPATVEAAREIERGTTEFVASGAAPTNSPAQPEVLAAPPGASATVVVPADAVLVSPSAAPTIAVTGTPINRAIEVRWAVPASVKGGNATYTVTASPGNQKCTTSTTSCTFKKLDPWTAYSFAIKTVSASSASIPDSAPSLPVKPVRILQRGSTSNLVDLITPASAGKQTWKATGRCKLSGDKRKFVASKDAGLCTLSLTTAKSGKTPKTTRLITIVVKAVAK